MRKSGEKPSLPRKPAATLASAKPAAKKPTLATTKLSKKAVPRKRYKYDVCFSFAGENREYIYRVARCLKNKGVDVFYDNDEKAVLWGKDLPEHFDSLYQNQARYCVMFISKFYKEKLWTRLERRSAFARAFRSKREYILPAYFEDVTIPGVRKTLAHIDLRTHTPLQLALLIVAKLRGDLPGGPRFMPKKRSQLKK